MRKQVNAGHYDFSSYVTKERFASFWHQVHEVVSLGARRVLEIGPGPGIVTAILRTQGIHVTTSDIADDTGADVNATVQSLPFADEAFDVVLCCQVLEHMPFEASVTALAELRRVSSSGCVISLPQAGRYWRYVAHLPTVGEVQFALTPRLNLPAHVFDGQHHWELDTRGYAEKHVRQRYAGMFRSVRSFRVEENPYHRFLVLLK